jgi:L-histidine Nalpha-methyltransferase
VTPDPKELAAAFLAASSPRSLVLDVGSRVEHLREDIANGFAIPGRRSIPCTYFYDQVGSEIYEEITRLPEYYPTRTEAAILRAVAPELHRRLGASWILELGSGSSSKTRLLLDAWRAGTASALYTPIDVSREMLRSTAEALCADYPSLRVLALLGRYEDALAALPTCEDALVCFLGGTLGNFEPDAQARFFQNLAGRMAPGSHLLLGFDRRPHTGKPARRIYEAYNDAAGVTARFNLNLLARINRELGANFRVERFAHIAPYNEPKAQIEMYLESLDDQEVAIEALSRSYVFSRGERILTEISRKYDPKALAGWFGERGFSCVEIFSDDAGLFGLLLLRRDLDPIHAAPTLAGGEP